MLFVPSADQATFTELEYKQSCVRTGLAGKKFTESGATAPDSVNFFPARAVTRAGMYCY